MDPGLFNRKTSVSPCRPQHLEHYHTEHRCPQGCVLSPLLFTLLTHDCTAKFSSNHIIKFADDTTVVGLISNNDETHYREEMAQLAEWCGANNLSLNVEKTKEVVMDFRRRNSTDHPPLTIDSSTVERVSSTKFLGVHITEDLTWTTNTMSLSKKAQQRLHFLRWLKRASLPPPILTTFYRGTIESVLTSCITVWYGNSTLHGSSDPIPIFSSHVAQIRYGTQQCKQKKTHGFRYSQIGFRPHSCGNKSDMNRIRAFAPAV